MRFVKVLSLDRNLLTAQALLDYSIIRQKTTEARDHGLGADPDELKKCIVKILEGLRIRKICLYDDHGSENQ